MDGKKVNKDIYEDYYKSVSLFKTTSPGNRWLFYLIRELFKGIDASSVGSILDVGCGEGSKTFFLKGQFAGARVLGIDFSASGIEAATDAADAGVEFRCVDVEDLSVWDDKFDLISCLGVLEHVVDWKGLLDRIVESSNNYVLIEVPIGRMRKFEANVGHLRNFAKHEIEWYLLEHGFVPVKVFYAGFPFFSPISRDLGNLLYRFYHENIESVNESTVLTRLYSSVMYFLFRFCSSRYRFGDQFLGLFRRDVTRETIL